MKLITTDIYEGAYLMSQDMRLEKLWINGRNGRRKVLFQFAGDNAECLRNEYQKGRAAANILSFKQSLNELKDRMFNLIRTAPAGQERRRENEWRQFTVK